MNLSIVIASYNRADDLLKFLQELSHQVIPEGLEWEIVIVDNNSTDGTRSRVAPFVEGMPGRSKYVLERRQGKSIALNSGIRAATGDILVFTDDDCIPDPRWLATIADEFTADPSLAVLGGRVELFNPLDRPVTIRTSLERTVISTRDQLFLLMIGANMALRRSAFRMIGDFDPFLGPGSKIGAVMEDLDILYRAFRKGVKILYSPAVLVYHNHGRTTEDQIRALNHRYVVGRGAFYCKHILRGDVEALKMAYWEFSSLSKSLLKQAFAGKRIREQRELLWALFVGVTGRLVWNQRFRKV